MNMPTYPSPMLAHQQRRRIRPRPVLSTFALAAIGFCLMMIAGVAYFAGMQIAGALYAAFFLILTASTPSYAFMLIFAFAPFAWDIGGGPVNMAISEISLALALPVVFIRTPPSAWSKLRSPFWLPVIAYFLVCVFSTIANPEYVKFGIVSMLQMAVYVILCTLVFSVCISGYQSVLPALYGFLAVMCFLAVVVIVTGNAFLFGGFHEGLHKNLVGTELMYAVVIAFEMWLAKAVRKEPRKLAICVLGLLLVGLLVSRSRGAWMGAFVGIMFILMMRRQFTLAIRTFFFLVPVLVLSWIFLLSDDAKEYVVTVDTSDQFGSMATRARSITFAISEFLRQPLYGNGVGLRKLYDATNVVLSTLAETGVLGFIAFMGIFVTLFGMAWSAQKRIARTDPMFSLLVIGVALMFGKFCHGLVDHYWSRGIIPVWAGAGMASFAWSYAQRNNPKKALERRQKAWRQAGMLDIHTSIPNPPPQPPPDIRSPK